MRLNGELATVQARAMALGERVAADERWLAGGFLRDGVLNPTRYLDRAERHKTRRRALFALTERLLAEAPLRPVA